MNDMSNSYQNVDIGRKIFSIILWIIIIIVLLCIFTPLGNIKINNSDGKTGPIPNDYEQNDYCDLHKC